jgi:putative glutamine amidotransferase
MTQVIATSPGTGLDIVSAICKALNMELQVLKTVDQVKLCKPDGVMLLGGADIDPFYYGEGRGYAKKIDNRRDLVEWMLIRRAMTRQIPIMGICRGMQMIAVAHGAGLYQDMVAQKVTNNHPSSHEIGVTGKLADCIPTTKVNSYHHQAVRKAPDGFKVLARNTADNIIEAIYKPGVLGVQWHPELMFPHDARWINLFRWFRDGLT